MEGGALWGGGWTYVVEAILVATTRLVGRVYWGTPTNFLAGWGGMVRFGVRGSVGTLQ